MCCAGAMGSGAHARSFWACVMGWMASLHLLCVARGLWLGLGCSQAAWNLLSAAEGPQGVPPAPQGLELDAATAF